jgi:succinate--hydroxymethylglutarate CoA-transferase
MTGVTEAARGPLAGIRVIDLTRILAGPLCTMMLGDMGADVIKVEPPGAGDDTRRWGPPFVGEEAAYFLGVNRNKRSLTLNMAAPAGQKILADLIAKADVLIDNFRLGTLEKWGFTDAWFEAAAPRLIRCSITGYGSSGPKAALPGYDFVLQAESGLMSICGEPDGVPTKYGVAIVDVCTGMLAGNAILAALNARPHTGKGQKVELSLYESSLFMLVNVASNYLMAGRDGGRFGNGHPSIVPYTTYQAADAMMAIAVGNERQFASCAEVLGHPEWATDARFASNRARVENRATIDGLINAALAREKAEHWLARLKAVGVPCGRINSVAEALDDPHTAARAMVETVEHPAIGALKMLGVPFKFSDTECSVRRAPPKLGEHSEEILATELGYGNEALAQLRRDGVV